LTPVCLEVSDGLNILHTTSDILHVSEIDGQLEITLYGDRDLVGEMVFEGKNVRKIKSATISSGIVKIVRNDKRTVLTYNHEHRKEFILGVKIN
jgi:hypothetical protein